LNRKGVTIVELLIYIVLFTIALFFIGKQFGKLVDNYSGNKRVLQQQTSARNILGLMIHEIRNTGLKVYLHKSGTSLSRNTATGAIVGIGTPPDSSSFVHKQGNPYDEITIYKIRLDGTGDYELTDTTRYYMNGTTLRREYRPSSGRITNSVVAENVYALQYEYGVLASTTLKLNQSPLTSANSTNWEYGGSPSPSLNTSSISLIFPGAATGWLRCKTPLSVSANENYTIALSITASGSFPQNLNWIQCSFKSSNRTQTYGSEQFKPWANPVEITVPVKTSSSANGAYLCLDYSSSGNGSLLITGLTAKCSQIANYNWTFAPTRNSSQLTDKINVRAIRIYLLTRTSEKADTKSNGTLQVGEISVNTTGNFTWRLYTEMVETPNNGIF
jgi:hypothetical protein